MALLRLVGALTAVLLVAVPIASAASARGELASGQIVIPDSARIESVGLNLLSVGPTPPQVEFSLTDVAVHRIGHTELRTAFPEGGVNNRAVDERASFATATITLLQGEGDQLAAARAAGPSSATVGPSQVRGVAGAFLASAMPGDGWACDDHSEEIAQYCLDVFGAYEIAGDASAGVASGEFVLLLYGPTLRLVASGETAEFASGLRDTQSVGPATQIEDTWVVVRATQAVGSISATNVKLYSIAPTISASAIEFMDAEGSVRVGALDYRANSEDIIARGTLVLSPGPVAPGTRNGPDGAPVYASAFTTRLTGDVQSINLNANPVFLDSPAKQAGFAALLALLIAGIAYAWQHISFLGAALYTRLNKPDILDNTVRNRIYDIIRSNPGISAREVHRRSEQSWGTVVYHLRQLERHHLVVSRSLGRTRNYYENHGKYRGMEAQLACLQSDRARMLARAIAGTPGITQEQLAAATGYPQPTTSYYVRKLKQAGLVEEQREGRYVKYVPHADLPRYIALSERSVDVGGAAASGVQA